LNEAINQIVEEIEWKLREKIYRFEGKIKYFTERRERIK
jgi:hypothetical protein